MRQIYCANNLPFWTADDIRERAQFSDTFACAVESAFKARNRAWNFERIEAPMLIPRDLLSAEYTDEQIFAIPQKPSALRERMAFELSENPALENEIYELARLADPRFAASVDRPRFAQAVAQSSCETDRPELAHPDFAPALAAFERLRPESALALRPETTPATYAWMERTLQERANSLPYCCWQLNKSFRREQDQSSKHMRLKEFWQQEFQCAYASDSADDYQPFCLEPVRQALADITRCPARIVLSDRLPSYSVRTFDIECWNSQKWMEVCSISKRIDFPDSARLPSKAACPEREILVCEIATSPDRQHYCKQLWKEAWKTLNPDELSELPDPDLFVSNAQAAQAKALRRSQARSA